MAVSTTLGPRIERFETLDGSIVYDVEVAPCSGGGTRLAPDLDEAEVCLLARAMTYKLAVLELPIGGAKIGLRCAPRERAETLERFRREIAERLEQGTLMTGPDLGTTEADFAGLPRPGERAGVAALSVGGVPAEELLTGCGVVSAIEAALGGTLRHRAVALEGFGKMGASIARELAARGGRIVAVSTLAGCAVAEPGTHFPVERLLAARERLGDGLIGALVVEVRRPEAVWSAACDVLVPGARPGALDEHRAQRVRADIVVPVANAPYTAAGLEVLCARGIDAHADFVASAGGAMAYLSPRIAGARDVEEARTAMDGLMGAIVREALEHHDGPYAGAVARAERFLRTWLAPTERPDGPPLA